MNLTSPTQWLIRMVLAVLVSFAFCYMMLNTQDLKCWRCSFKKMCILSACREKSKVKQGSRILPDEAKRQKDDWIQS